MNEHMSDKNNKGLQLQMCNSIRMSISTSPVRLISCNIFSYANVMDIHRCFIVRIWGLCFEMHMALRLRI